MANLAQSTNGQVIKMCGIAGIINYNGLEEKREVLRRMIALMRHRGPDAAGMFVQGPAGFAHTRLSIIDLDSGDQPIHNEDKSIWAVFNGEIFNYPGLREGLIKKGHRFYTQSDTEVLVHLYEEKGTHLFDDLNGQFAVAIWDQREEKLILGRDRVGIKPLFYHENQNRLVFGSEIKALFADNTIPREIEVRTLSDIFTCWAPLGSASPFKGVYQFPPGHFATYSRKGFDVTPFWRLTFEPSGARQHALGDWVDELSFLLRDATRMRLRADVPVGAYLSGGLDSTYISALVGNYFDNRLRTFSVSFSDKRFDEATYQSKAVKALATEHRTINCSEVEIGEIFPQIIWHTETPIVRTAPAPLFMLSKLVRENGFKVVLTGEGADEMFAGYNIFKEDKIRRFWSRNPESRMRPELLAKLYPYIFSPENKKAKQFLMAFFQQELGNLRSPAYSHILRWRNSAQLKSFFSADVQNEVDPLEQFVSRFANLLPEDFMTWHSMSKAQYTESIIFLSNYLLSSQGDRMTMGNSVEGRYPFLDHRVIEFAGRVPHRFRMRALQEKYLLKQAAQGLVPDEVITRAKQPYRAPISHAFFGKTTPDYVNELLSEQSIRATGYFDGDKVSRLLNKCQTQGGRLVSERENMALVAILSTQLLDHQFIRHFASSASPDFRSAPISNHPAAVETAGSA